MTDSSEFLSKIHLINSFRESIRKVDTSHLCLTLLDSYLRYISKSPSVETPTSQETKKRKLDMLLKICEIKDAQEHPLQIAIMEIPDLASPEDQASLTALSNLVNHPDRYVRINACKSIGLLGGKEAKRILGDLQQSKDPIISSTANKLLKYSEMHELASTLEGQLWRNESVDYLLRLAVRPYKRAIKSVNLLFFLLVIELLIATTFVIWRAL